MEEPPFWLVWRDGGPSSTRQHKSEARAEAEAIRLARENPGVKFYVMPAAISISFGGLNVQRFTLDDIPF